MRRGGQTPTFEVVGKYAYSDGSQAVEMFEEYGRKYYDSQKYEMELFYARKDDGTFASNTISIAKPRQNGKSFTARDYALDSACMGGLRVLYSAHHGKTSRDMYKEMRDFVKAHEDFLGELKEFYGTGGYEGIYFQQGCIEFQTRTNSGARGGTYSLVIIDEAQELTDAQQEALLPVISASQEIGDGSGTQVIYLGTPPSDTCQGTVFKELHDRAHKGTSNSWWLEWAVQGETLDDVNIDDVETWYACNPAMGRRMSLEAVQNEHGTMTKAGFARERLGWWSGQVVNCAINEIAWRNCATSEPPADGSVSYAVKFTPDGSTGVIAGCVSDGGKPHVEIIEIRSMNSGLSWFADWLEAREDRTNSICIDGLSNAQPLIDELLRRGISKRKLIKPKYSDITTACSTLLNLVKECKITHFNQEPLNMAIKTTSKRNIGANGGFGFGGSGSELLEAIALAVWCLKDGKKNSGKKMRVSI